MFPECSCARESRTNMVTFVGVTNLRCVRGQASGWLSIEST